MKKLLTVAAMLLAIPQTSFSQTAQNNAGFRDGYIVTTTNDTLSGEIKFRRENDKMLKRLRYRKDRNSATRSIGPKKIKSFQLGRFIYIVHNGKYLQEISRGVNLNIYERRSHIYKYRPESIVTQSGFNQGPIITRSEKEKLRIYLIKKDGNHLHYRTHDDLISKKLKEKLTEFFKDQTKLTEKINESYYTNADIIYMAYEYNEPEKYQLKPVSKEMYKQEKRKRKKDKL